MSKLSKSPARNTFQPTKYLERRAQEGKTPENDPNVKAMVDMYESFSNDQERRENDPKWAKDNMEYDLRSTDWILEKVRSNDAYAQNLYAAMCNNGFIKLDVIPILKQEEWSCSWRYAGGIIADMQQKGDYIDWYCSGIRNVDEDEEVNKLWDGRNYVPEGCITDEIRNDLQRLGWAVAPDGDWNNFTN